MLDELSIQYFRSLFQMVLTSSLIVVMSRVSPLKLTPWFLFPDNQTKTEELEAEIHENDSEMLRESLQTELILVELGRLIHPEVALKQLNNINHWKVFSGSMIMKLSDNSFGQLLMKILNNFSFDISIGNNFKNQLCSLLKVALNCYRDFIGNCVLLREASSGN